MYEALVARVRYHIQKASFMGLKDAESTLLLAEAADAIEELLRKEKFHAFIWNTLGFKKMRELEELYREQEATE